MLWNVKWATRVMGDFWDAALRASCVAVDVRRWVRESVWSRTLLLHNQEEVEAPNQPHATLTYPEHPVTDVQKPREEQTPTCDTCRLHPYTSPSLGLPRSFVSSHRPHPNFVTLTDMFFLHEWSTNGDVWTRACISRTRVMYPSYIQFSFLF